MKKSEVTQVHGVNGVIGQIRQLRCEIVHFKNKGKRIKKPQVNGYIKKIIYNTQQAKSYIFSLTFEY